MMACGNKGRRLFYLISKLSGRTSIIGIETQLNHYSTTTYAEEVGRTLSINIPEPERIPNRGFGEEPEAKFEKSDTSNALTITDEPSKSSEHIYRGICPWKSREEMSSYLCQHVISEAGGVIAINKPFGLGVRNIVGRKAVEREHELASGRPDPRLKNANKPQSNLYHSRGVATTPYTLEDMVPLLRLQLGIPELQLVKSPERYASGVALFAVNEATAKKLQYCIKRTKELKERSSNYLIVSTNIPKLRPGDKREERVGIKLQEDESTNNKQPVIMPTFSNNAMYAGTVYPAQVKLELRATNRNLTVACAELQTDLTKWNFLRVYSAHALMPILGDHLYSGRVQSVMGVNIALPPMSVRSGATNQKLTNQVLAALRLRRPEDSLIIPLHVHLQTYTISWFFGKQKDLIIHAKPPEFFEWTCKKLGLNLKPKQ